MDTTHSTVPVPDLDAEPPPVEDRVYGMPMFPTVPTADLAASVEFWTRGLGFVDLFTVPGRLTHLRRWRFQDVLLVPGDPSTCTALGPNVACVLRQLDEVAAACEHLVPGCTTGPERRPWNSLELEVRTPEGTRVVLTAALPLDPRSPAAQDLRDLGLDVPG
ncbi:VOC family protein [Kineococcus rhizosphaerae]|uniref:Glyoxalase/fosfomycin resistance/dioxygenase domain-containing protein n=1 Tax=Kineococcus rhizosphaerae TaxID=559628 RepID=A0A2T0QWT6_9ACTN|nr:hypothetical protein CLV37_12029 [Kineococcus rhizosphaerae]